jgi:hypothetical protein
MDMPTYFPFCMKEIAYSFAAEIMLPVREADHV